MTAVSRCSTGSGVCSTAYTGSEPTCSHSGVPPVPALSFAELPPCALVSASPKSAQSIPCSTGRRVPLHQLTILTRVRHAAG